MKKLILLILLMSWNVYAFPPTPPSGPGTVEGTAVLSTGEAGGTKFLREDGDGTSSWQTPAGGGNVSKVGTPAQYEIGEWTGDGTIKGTAVAGDSVLCTDANGSPEACSNLTDITPEPADSAIEKTDENEVITGTREFQAGVKVDGYLQLFDTCLTSAPGSPIEGAFYCADYTNWDPITYSGAVAYIVQYDGASYIGKFDIDGNNISNGEPSQTPITDDADNFAANFTGSNLKGGTFRTNADGTAALPNATYEYNFTITDAGGTPTIEPLATGTDDTIILNENSCTQGVNIVSDGTTGNIASFQYGGADTWIVYAKGFTCGS